MTICKIEVITKADTWVIRRSDINIIVIILSAMLTICTLRAYSKYVTERGKNVKIEFTWPNFSNIAQNLGTQCLSLGTHCLSLHANH